jgi:hypothetical protein
MLQKLQTVASINTPTEHIHMPEMKWKPPAPINIYTFFWAKSTFIPNHSSSSACNVPERLFRVSAKFGLDGYWLNVSRSHLACITDEHWASGPTGMNGPAGAGRIATVSVGLGSQVTPTRTVGRSVHRPSNQWAVIQTGVLLGSWPRSASWLPVNQQCFSFCSFELFSEISSHPIMFFSHNKPANNTFSYNKQAKRTGCLSHINSAPATTSQQYFSLTTNQHQPPANRSRPFF